MICDTLAVVGVGTVPRHLDVVALAVVATGSDAAARSSPSVPITPIAAR